jgi:hypothetical protein
MRTVLVCMLLVFVCTLSYSLPQEDLSNLDPKGAEKLLSQHSLWVLEVRGAFASTSKCEDRIQFKDDYTAKLTPCNGPETSEPWTITNKGNGLELTLGARGYDLLFISDRKHGLRMRLRTAAGVKGEMTVDVYYRPDKKGQSQ